MKLYAKFIGIIILYAMAYSIKSKEMAIGISLTLFLLQDSFDNKEDKTNGKV
jgi:hypothetical protein